MFVHGQAGLAAENPSRAFTPVFTWSSTDLKLREPTHLRTTYERVARRALELSGDCCTEEASDACLIIIALHCICTFTIRSCYPK